MVFVIVDTTQNISTNVTLTYVNNEVDFQAYARSIFQVLAQSDVVLLTEIPKTTSTLSCPFFIIKSSPSALQAQFYQFKSKETGWVRSVKINECVMVKEITGVKMQLWEQLNKPSQLSQPVENQNVNGCGGCGSCGVIEQNETMYSSTSKYQKGILAEIKQYLATIELAKPVSEKRRIAMEMFSRLAEPDVEVFLKCQTRLRGLIGQKMVEFYHREKMTELKDCYMQIFKKDIALEIPLGMPTQN